MAYASLLSVEQADSFIQVEIRDAWHTHSVSQRYILVPHNRPVPAGYPEGIVLRTPLKRVVTLSSVHAALLCELGCSGVIAGLCDTDYIVHPALRQLLDEGHVTDMGSSMNPDVERLLQVRPDVLFVSSTESGAHEALRRAGIPFVECADYMETSALGRAEWMKFFGLLLGCEAFADSLFEAVETDYKQLCRAVSAAVPQPSLLCDVKQGAVWYVPGGQSYLGKLYADAGANYLFSDNADSGSAGMSFETVFAKASKADVWLVKYGAASDLTYAQMVADYRPYTEFRPWRDRHIYGCNTMKVPFYEEVPFHPERLLRDMVHILHPEVLPRHQLRYYTPLK